MVLGPGGPATRCSKAAGWRGPVASWSGKSPLMAAQYLTRNAAAMPAWRVFPVGMDGRALWRRLFVFGSLATNCEPPGSDSIALCVTRRMPPFWGLAVRAALLAIPLAYRTCRAE